jgi:hypothetical protein
VVAVVVALVEMEVMVDLVVVGLVVYLLLDWAPILEQVRQIKVQPDNQDISVLFLPSNNPVAVAVEQVLEVLHLQLRLPERVVMV